MLTLSSERRYAILKRIAVNLEIKIHLAFRLAIHVKHIAQA